MRFTCKSLDSGLVVLLVAIGTLSCAAHSPTRHPLMSYEQQVADVDAKLAALRPILRGYPPRISSEKQKQKIVQKWKEAEGELKNLAERSAGDPAIELRLGELYRFGHNLDVPGAGELCISHLQHAIALRPDYADAYLELGIFYTDAGVRWAPLGERNLRKAIELSGPTSLPRAWRGLTFAYYYQGEFSDSVTAADEYLRLVPEDADLQRLRKLAQQAASRGATGLAPVGRVLLPQ